MRRRARAMRWAAATVMTAMVGGCAGSEEPPAACTEFAELRSTLTAYSTPNPSIDAERLRSDADRVLDTLVRLDAATAGSYGGQIAALTEAVRDVRSSAVDQGDADRARLIDEARGSIEPVFQELADAIEPTCTTPDGG